MALLVAEAAKLGLNELQRGVIQEIITSSNLFARLPIRVVNGKAFDYNRENTLGSAS